MASSGPPVRDDTIDVGGPARRLWDKDWDSDKLHFDPEAIMEATPVTGADAAATRFPARDQRRRDRGDPIARH